MAEPAASCSSGASLPLIESGNTAGRGEEVPPVPPSSCPPLRMGHGRPPAHAPCSLGVSLTELYFLIARFLSTGPCRRALKVSPGLSGARGPRAARAGSGGGGSSRSPRSGGAKSWLVPDSVFFSPSLCRCWCRSWSSTRSVWALMKSCCSQKFPLQVIQVFAAVSTFPLFNTHCCGCGL